VIFWIPVILVDPTYITLDVHTIVMISHKDKDLKEKGFQNVMNFVSVLRRESAPWKILWKPRYPEHAVASIGPLDEAIEWARREVPRSCRQS
jgi:hypothetical protein